MLQPRPPASGAAAGSADVVVLADPAQALRGPPLPAPNAGLAEAVALFRPKQLPKAKPKPKPKARNGG